jgi:hypothetical protein
MRGRSTKLSEVAQLLAAGRRFYLSEKIDGFRAIYSTASGRLFTASGLPFPNAAISGELCSALAPLTCLNRCPVPRLIEGELTIPGLPFHAASGVMRRRNSPARWFFQPFDIIPAANWLFAQSAAQRIEELSALLGGKHPQIQPIKQTLVFSPGEVFEEYLRVLDAGGEGVMLKDASRPYRSGRVTTYGTELLKLKAAADLSAEVIGTTPLLRNTNEATADALGYAERSTAADGLIPDELLGALILRILPGDHPFQPGTVFSCGVGSKATGFLDMAARRSLWKERFFLIGRRLRVSYLPAGSDQRPRSPIAVCWEEAA